MALAFCRRVLIEVEHDDVEVVDSEDRVAQPMMFAFHLLQIPPSNSPPHLRGAHQLVVACSVINLSPFTFLSKR